MTFNLLIWDCDGCLVDSEIHSSRAWSGYLAKRGGTISPEDFTDRCAGHSGQSLRDLIERETGVKVQQDEMPVVRELILERFARDLKPSVGVRDVVSALNLPMCIASGSTIERNLEALRITELLPFFEGRVYSSYQVANSKPAPDVFLFAAEQMGIASEQSLVIEDSVAGVQAAKAAGMTVFAYMGGSHVTPAWRARVAAQAPDLVFDNMRQLPELMAQYKVAS